MKTKSTITISYLEIVDLAVGLRQRCNERKVIEAETVLLDGDGNEADGSEVAREYEKRGIKITYSDS